MASLAVGVFFGSVRESRKGIGLAKYIVKALDKRGHRPILFDPAELNLPLLKHSILVDYHGDASKFPPWLADLRQRVAACDAYIVVTAEYNRCIPPALSNLLDHVDPPAYHFKAGSIVSYSMGQGAGTSAAMQMRCLLGELGVNTTQFVMSVPTIHEAVTDDGDVKVPRVTAATEKLINELTWLGEAIKNHKDKTPAPAYGMA